MGRYVTTAASSYLLNLALLLSQGCSSVPKRETAFVDNFPMFPQGFPQKPNVCKRNMVTKRPETRERQ
jgi:hypothetical protein